MGGDPTTFVVSQTAHTPPGVVPPPRHLTRACNARWAKKALLRTRPISTVWGNIRRDVHHNSASTRPNADRSPHIMFADVTADDVQRAEKRLRDTVRRTELRHATRLAKRTERDVWLKLENEQVTGSFKIRGAYNAIASLSPADRARGVVTASAGNHGRGVALAAQQFGIRATIFIPRTAPRVKIDGMRDCGASIDAESAHYDEAHARAIAFAKDHDVTYVDPTAGAPLVAGHGTVALEIVEQLPAVACVIVPVGGGGLAGGMGAFLRAARPDVRIIGAQSANTSAMARSLEAGQVVDIPVLPTLADGLAGAINEHGLDVGRHALDEIIVVEEADVAAAIAFLAREENVVAEGSGAVGVAALLAGAPTVVDPVVIVVSGGNIDTEVLSRILA